MRKLFVGSLCVLALLATLPASAGPTSRRVSFEYEGANSFEDPQGTMYASFGSYENVKPRTGERFVSVEVVDETGRAVAAQVHQGNKVLGGTFCGETPSPRALFNSRAVHVHLYVGPGCEGASAPTQGTVTITFTRKHK